MFLWLLLLMTTWFVDGVNGNDANAGTSFAQAFKTIARAAASSAAQAGDTVNICATGPYVLTSNVSLSESGSQAAGPITFTGANASGVVDGTKASVTTATNNVDLFNLNGHSNLIFDNLNLSSTAGTPGSALACKSTNSTNVTLRNSKVSGCLSGVYGAGIQGSEWWAFAFTIANCEITGCTLSGLRLLSGIVLDCDIHGNAGGTTDGVLLGPNQTVNADLKVVRSNLYANGRSGIYATNQTTGTSTVLVTATDCAFYGNGADGITIPFTTSSVPCVLRAENNVFALNGGYGINASSATLTVAVNRANGYFTNTSGNRNNVPTGAGDLILSADPFVAGGSGNFALNTTAGAGEACRAAGLPGTFPAGTTIGYPDMGAAQHQDSGGGGSPPATPSLSVADNGDGTGAVATISGSTAGASNTVQAVSLSASGSVSWTDFGPRTGDGTQALALSDGRYLAIAVSAAGGLDSAPSSPFEFYVTGGSGNTPSVRAALYSFLSSQASITALVGSRIFPIKVPQGQPRPAIVYRRMPAKGGDQRFPEEEGHAHDLSGSAGYAAASFKIDCLGDKYSDADQLANALRLALDGVNQDTVAGVTLLSALIDDELDDFDEPIDGSDSGVFVVSTLYRIAYDEAV